MKNRDLNRTLRKNNILKSAVIAVIFAASMILLIINPVNNNVRISAVDDISQADALYHSGTRYIQYTAQKLYYSGMDYRVNGKTRARIYYGLDNGKCHFFIICTDKISSGSATVENFTLNARLIHNDNMYAGIIARLSDNVDFAPQGLDTICSETIISQYDFSHGFFIYYDSALLIICIISGIGTLIQIFTVIVPSSSMPVYHLRKYGNKSALFEAASQEFKSSQPPRISGLYVTDNFIFHITRFDADIIPLESVTWIYTSKKVRHSHGAPKLRSTFCILTENRRTYRIKHVSDKIASDIISDIQTRYPSIMADGR